MGSLIATLTVAAASFLYGLPNQICYEQIGCFSNEAPWASMGRPVPLPQHPADVCTFLVFFNKRVFNETIRIYPSISTKLARLYNPSLKTYILCHGWANSGYYMWEMAQDIIENKKDANILSIDWGKSAELLDYLQAVADVRVAGAVVQRVVYQLINLGGKPSDFHFIGHSLGAHILAYVAKTMSVKIARLTGMDIAGPFFEGHPKEVRFSSSDAIYTEAVHSSAGISGYLGPTAHTDYYFNAAFVQPGCIRNPRKIFNLTVPESPLVFPPLTYLICDHGSSYLFYREAILNQGCFIGRKMTPGDLLLEVLRTLELTSGKNVTDDCDKVECVKLDFDSPQTEKRGSFIVGTNKNSPFCRKK